MYFIIPLINFLGLELAYIRFPALIYAVSALVFILTIVFVSRQIRQTKEHRSAIVITVSLFLIAHYLLLVFLEGAFLVHSFIFITSFALFVFLYGLHDKYHAKRLKLNYALENIIGYFNLAIFFFLTVDIFYFDLNSNQKFLWLLWVFIFFVVLLAYSSFDIFNIAFKRALLYIGIILLLTVEIFWTVNLLPISVYSKGALVTLVYYVVLGISRHYLIFGYEEISRRVVARYIVISLIGAILVFLTARW